MAELDVRRTSALAKAPSGIRGLDALTWGGFPRGRVTLVEGGPGAGKTVLALQSLVYAARERKESCIFVAFEERTAQIEANSTSFGWDLPRLRKQRLFLLDAQPDHTAFQSGDFDLEGLLTALDVKIGQMGARRIVFDALDVVLGMLKDPSAEDRELYRLRDWILARGITTLITSRGSAEFPNRRHRDVLQFLADCAITLHHRLDEGISQRGVRVLKYRGSGFHENEAPYVMGSKGMEISWVGEGREAPVLAATNERISTGVARLDAMLGGGLYRQAGILITGAPGTAKTTLAGAFADAACRRGDRTLLVSFDSLPGEVVRNLRSVNLRLERHLGSARRSGPLRMIHARALSGSAETHLLEIQSEALRHQATCVVIDPLSALARCGSPRLAQSVARRLHDWAKGQGITLLCTSLLEDSGNDAEISALQISTISDTWMHLSYVVRAGERNRCLTIIKSRGTGHSNQVRELVLNTHGITLADAYSATGEPLLGTLRWEHEQAELETARLAERTEVLTRVRLASEEAVLQAQLLALKKQLESKQVEARALAAEGDARRLAQAEVTSERGVRRGADASHPARSRHGRR
jgi:circadian clock protein KaiC